MSVMSQGRTAGRNPDLVRQDAGVSARCVPELGGYTIDRIRTRERAVCDRWRYRPYVRRPLRRRTLAYVTTMVAVMFGW